MPVYKRYKGKRVHHTSSDYKRARWIAEGMFESVRYNEPLPFAGTRKEAELEEKKILEDIHNGDYALRRDKSSYREYVEKYYLPRVKAENESFENNKKYQIERLLKFFGDYRLKQISRKLCEDYRTRRSSERVTCQKCASVEKTCYRCSGENPRYKAPCWHCRRRLKGYDVHKATCEPPKVKNGTVNHDLTTHSHILSEAIKDGKIKKNPMEFVALLPENEPRSRVLSEAEKTRLFKALSKPSPTVRRLWTIILIGVTTSWRQGRILALKKEDLNEEMRAVRVAKSKQDAGKFVPVSSMTWDVLSIAAAQVESGALFRNAKTGEPLERFPKDGWRQILKDADIKDLHFHDLRHQAATELTEQGAHLFNIQNALGHKRISTTQRYVTVRDDSLRNDLEKQGEGYREYLN